VLKKHGDQRLKITNGLPNWDLPWPMTATTPKNKSRLLQKESPEPFDEKL
jgi:hypothetical protein